MIVYNLKDNHKKQGFSINLTANGGTDMNGEWQFSGSYDFVAWNKYKMFQGHISKFKNKWIASIGCGYSNRNITKIKETSLKKLQKSIENYILSDDKYSRYYDLYTTENIKKLIFKEISGVMTWIATEFNFSRAYVDSTEYGYGLFYTASKKHWVKDRLDRFSFGYFKNRSGCHISGGLEDSEKIKQIHNAIYNMEL